MKTKTTRAKPAKKSAAKRAPAKIEFAGVIIEAHPNVIRIVSADNRDQLRFEVLSKREFYSSPEFIIEVLRSGFRAEKMPVSVEFYDAAGVLQK